MKLSLSIVSALAIVAIAGCAASGGEETELSEDFLTQEAEEPAPAEKPIIWEVDLKNVDFDLARFGQENRIDWSKEKFDVLDEREIGPRWVASDTSRSLEVVEKFKGGVGVFGGKCRPKNLSLKKIVINCTWKF